MASAIGRHNWQFKPLPGQPCHTLRMLFAALLSFSRYIRNDRTIPRNTRTPLANQLAFYAGKFLELIRRVAPDKVGELFMSDARKPNPNMPRPKGGKRGPSVLPTAPLSARQAAKRLEHFLNRITALADEAAKLGHPLPQQIRDLMARAHGSFGIDALYRTPQNLAGLRRALRGLPRPRPGQSFMPKAPSITPPTGQPLMPPTPPTPKPTPHKQE